MRYLRTSLATDWPDESAKSNQLRKWMSVLIPDANPEYESKLHLVEEWLIEFDDNGVPGREIGLGKDEVPLFCGPNNVNYGFWLDTNMTLPDFEGSEISEAQFENLWSQISRSRKI